MINIQQNSDGTKNCICLSRFLLQNPNRAMPLENQVLFFTQKLLKQDGKIQFLIIIKTTTTTITEQYFPLFQQIRAQ